RARLALGRLSMRASGRAQGAELGLAERLAVVHEQTLGRAQGRDHLTDGPDLAVEIDEQRQVEQSAALERLGAAAGVLAARVPLQVTNSLATVLLELERIGAGLVGLAEHSFGQAGEQDGQQIVPGLLVELVE